MANSTQTSNSRAQDADLQKSITEAATKAAHEAVEKLNQKASPTESKLRDKAAQASDALHEKQEQLQSQINQSVDSARTLAKENPLATVGIAFAAGAILTALISKR